MRNSSFLLIIPFLLVGHSSNGQNRLRIPVGSFEKNNSTIIGLGVGLTDKDEIANVTTVGIHFELLGGGGRQLSSYPPPEIPKDISSEHIYGLNISPLGTFTQNVQIAGISLSLLPTGIKKMNGLMVSWPTVSKVQIVNGIQISFLYSVAGIVNGIQFGIGNMAKTRSVGVQVGGGNEAAHHEGIQISLYNKATKLEGLQISIYNAALTESAGMQIGLGNKSETFTGLQIGILNFSEHLKGLQIGLLNVSGKRVLPFLNW